MKKRNAFLTDLFDFDTPVTRWDTASIKWDLYKGKDIIPLWLADMDFKSSPAIIEALQQRIKHGIFGYTYPSDELIGIVENRIYTLYGWHIKPDWLIWLPGLVSGLNVACRISGKEGDDILTMVPIYPPFLAAPRLSYRNLVTVPLVQYDKQWEIDFDRLKSVITSKTKLLLLCNPHNPVGRVFTRKELEKLVEICIKREILICSDEIHCELILDHDKKHIPTATLGAEAAERTITLMAPSKTFNIPGLGCSFAIIPDEKLRGIFKKAMTGIVPEVNTLGYTAALAAYRDSHDWHRALLDYLRRNRDLVENRIKTTTGLSMRHVQATYLAWIDTSSSGIKDPAKFFEEAGVALFNGRYFGTPGFLRLNFGCPRILLEKAMRRMKRAMEIYHHSQTKKFRTKA